MPELDGETAWRQLSDACFEIAGEDQLKALHDRFKVAPAVEAEKKQVVAKWSLALKDLKIRIGTLLKTDCVSILLGSGASKEAGGLLIRSVPKKLEQDLLDQGASGGKVRAWLRVFYLALRRGATPDEAASIPIDRVGILDRAAAVKLEDAKELQVNYEAVLSLLHRWRAALPSDGGRLRLDGDPSVTARSKDIDECLRRAKRVLAKRCVLPADGDGASALLAYRSFMKKLLTRPLNLKRVNLFTLNYDTLVEKAADGEGVVMLDGFVGTLRRVFRPESYDQDLYFPGDTTEGRVHRLDRVAHLYKLHGSLTWRATEPESENPYGVSVADEADLDGELPLIYPTPTKYGETLGMPYAELFRRFSGAVVRPQSTLFTIGYGYSDDHVTAIIRQALAIPSFTLVIIDPTAPAPNPAGTFVARLRSEADRRVWIISGQSLGRFSTFVEHVLPDLRDEEILRKVIDTYRALGPVPDLGPRTEGTNGE